MPRRPKKKSKRIAKPVPFNVFPNGRPDPVAWAISQKLVDEKGRPTALGNTGLEVRGKTKLKKQP